MKSHLPQPLPKVTVTEVVIVVLTLAFWVLIVVLFCKDLAQLSRSV
jgi:hypothetical protein